MCVGGGRGRVTPAVFDRFIRGRYIARDIAARNSRRGFLVFPSERRNRQSNFPAIDGSMAEKHAPEAISTAVDVSSAPAYNEKKGYSDIEINPMSASVDDFDVNSATKIYVPGDDEEFIDPRLKDYPIPLVA